MVISKKEKKKSLQSVKEQITRDLKVISEKEKKKKRSSVREGANYSRFESNFRKRKE